MDEQRRRLIRRIVDNGMIAALYFALTLLLTMVPVLSQFGPIQCRVSEVLVLLAFFRPGLTLGLSIGCFFANMVGALTGFTTPLDMAFGTLATAVACLGEAYLSPKLLVACIWPILINGTVVGVELYYLFNITEFGLWGSMGLVAAGEAVAIAIGYVLMMLLIRNHGFMSVLKPTRHQEVRW